MALVAPISEFRFDVDRSALDAVAPIKAAIDRGCSLLKVIYVAKNCDLIAPHYTLHCASFRNEDFEGALHFLKENAFLPQKGKLRVTGAGCTNLKDLIGEILGLEIEIINEFITIFRGIHFLLLHAAVLDDLFFVDNEDDIQRVEQSEQVKQMLEKAEKKRKETFPSKSIGHFPCIFVNLGSSVGISCVKADGTCRFLSGSMMGGKTLLGLGKAIAGTNNYGELMELASKGNVGNVDTTIEELIEEDPDSPYGSYPKDFPTFHFGKMADCNDSLENYGRADRAAAVVRMFAASLISVISSDSMRSHVTNVIFGGNVIHGEPMRKAMTQMSNSLTNNAICLQFLKCGHTGAIGAMISTNEDIKYLEMD